MKMSEIERACAYFEAMAEKVGGNVKVFTNARGELVMQRRDRLGAGGKSVKVSLEEPIARFNAKVQAVMGA